MFKSSLFKFDYHFEIYDNFRLANQSVYTELLYKINEIKKKIKFHVLEHLLTMQLYIILLI